MKKIYIALFCIGWFLSSWAQEYRRMINSGEYTVEQIQTEATAYFNKFGTGRGTGFKPYKRWEYQAKQNMDETGMLKSPDFYFEELQNYNAYINSNTDELFRSTTGNWEEMGPVSWNQTSGWNPGVGRITSFAVDENNDSHLIVGAETGGIWRSLDGGVSWTVLTDDLSNLSVYALAMDPNDASVYFWGTSGGVIFKSTDSGATWDFLADVGSGIVNKILRTNGE